MAEEKIRIVRNDVINHLHNGVVRKKGDNHYTPSRKSIEELYGLETDQVDLLFKDPVLAKKKVVPFVEPAFVLVDEEETTTTPTQDSPVPEAGDVTAASVEVKKAATKPKSPEPATDGQF